MTAPSNRQTRQTCWLPAVALCCFSLSLQAVGEQAVSTSTTGVPRSKDITPAQAMGFEKDGAWLSVPPDLLDNMDRQGISDGELSCVRPVKYKNWGPSQPGLTFADLAAGVLVSMDHVTEGNYSGKWTRHHLYPSIICDRVAGDWSGSDTFSVSIHSEINTGEVIHIGILSDNPETPWKDWYFHPFTVDWKGQKTLEIPFSAFTPFQKPLGWSNIGAVGFFTKAFGHQPSPATALWLDNIVLSSKKPAANLQTTSDAIAESYNYKQGYYEKAGVLNHSFPELGDDVPTVSPDKPILHGHYFAYERALHNYNPRFQPGYVSFDLKGKAYVKAGDRIQWLDGKGKWKIVDLGPTIAAWGKAKGWPGLRNNNAPNSVDPMIRFDRAGDAYILQNVTLIDAQGKEISGANRTSLLLHSRDGLRTWTSYVVPGGRYASFEKLDGHNDNCLDNPPVILNGGSGPGAHLVLPTKNNDGTLCLDTAYKYADNAIAGILHSGDGNGAISVGDKVYVVWGWCPDANNYPAIAAELKNKSDGDSWTWSNLKSTALGATLPPIPENHAAMSMTFKHSKEKSETCYAENGVPTFVSVFDRKTKEFVPPMFVGFGGYKLDGHNFPAITIDSKGYMTILINGHHDPLTYTRSLKPFDATAWTKPTYIHDGHDRLSYSTMTCDRNDTIFSVNRSTSDAYNNSLSLLRLKAGRDWEPERILVWPFKFMYMSWANKMTYDHTRDRLFLTYFCNGSGQQLAVDQYEFFIFQHPDQEPRVAANQGLPKENPGRILPYPIPLHRSGASFYMPELSDCSILVSNDHGETWRLATTEDFKSNDMTSSVSNHKSNGGGK